MIKYLNKNVYEIDDFVMSIFGIFILIPLAIVATAVTAVVVTNSASYIYSEVKCMAIDANYNSINNKCDKLIAK